MASANGKNFSEYRAGSSSDVRFEIWKINDDKASKQVLHLGIRVVPDPTLAVARTERAENIDLSAKLLLNSESKRWLVANSTFFLPCPRGCYCACQTST